MRALSPARGRRAGRQHPPAPNRHAREPARRGRAVGLGAAEAFLGDAGEVSGGGAAAGGLHRAVAGRAAALLRHGRRCTQRLGLRHTPDGLGEDGAPTPRQRVAAGGRSCDGRHRAGRAADRAGVPR